jgi:peroxisomal 3,2-trans-enoyl-CoA isomerase
VPDAYFFTPFVKWGLCAEACSSFSFANIMGRQKAAALILADERLTAADLERAGLVTAIISADVFLQEVMNKARRVARLPPQSLKFNKSLMMRTLRGPLLAANEAELKGLRERARSAEPKEAIKAFAEEQQAKRTKKSRSRSKL